MKFLNIDLYQLKEQSKRIVCFGAGKMFRNFLRNYSFFEFEKKIEVILDNNKEKEGSKIEIGDQKINVISVGNFCKNYLVENFILLITCVEVVSVYEQLQQVEQLKDMECCALVFAKSMTNEEDDKKRYYPSNLRVYDSPVIPKIIHYCWFGGAEIPSQNREWMATWKKCCPDYEIIEWNESNYDVKKNKYMYDAYQAKKWGFVSDYTRLDIIYNVGGIYLDTDVEIVKNLDELLYQDAFMGVDGSKNISLGLGFGAKPHFPLLKELMNEYDNYSFYDLNGVMQLVPAPTLQIPFFNSRGYINNGEFQRIGSLAIYPEKVLSGKCLFTRKSRPSEHTFSIHHYEGSWNSEERRMIAISNQEFYKNLDHSL